MSDEVFDVALVGAGPAGALTAGLLARHGWRVVLAERNAFPRFHIGESLLAQSLDVLERAGLLDRVRESGFVTKHGAVFIDGDGTWGSRFDFGDGDPPSRHPHAFQVERAAFDSLLLDWATDGGVDVRMPVDASNIRPRSTSERARVRFGSSEVSARFVVDAAGLEASAARIRGLAVEPPLKDRISLFGHFRLPQRLEMAIDEARAGDIVIVDAAPAWAWLIPLRDGVSSVGFVLPIPEFQSLDGSSALEKFTAMTARVPEVARIVDRVAPLSGIHGVRAFGRATSRMHDDGVVLVGDSAGFLDPVFSSGLCVALGSAELLATALDASLRDPSEERAALERYETAVRRAMTVMHAFVQHWYSGELRGLVSRAAENETARRRVTSILAGEIWDSANPLATDTARWLRALAATSAPSDEPRGRAL